MADEGALYFPTERSKFLALSEKVTLESIVEIYNFMGNLPKRPTGHAVEISKGFLETYERVATKLNPREPDSLFAITSKKYYYSV